MEQKNKNQNSALAILAMLVAVLVVIFFIVPKVSAIKDFSNQAVQKESELASGQAKVAAAKQFATLIKTARADIEKLGVSIPTEEKADEAILQAASAASSAGIGITSVSVSASDGTENATKTTTATEGQAAVKEAATGGVLSLTIATRGNYTATVDFLKKMESNLRPITLKNLSVASSVDSGSDVDGNFTLDFPYVAANATATSQPTTTTEVDNAK